MDTRYESDSPLDKLPDRYELIDRANRESWYVNDTERPFSVLLSVHSVGEPRSWEAKIGRQLLAGNMSTIRRPDGTVPYGPRDMSDQERYDDALNNMKHHFEVSGVSISRVRVLNPERDYSTPLTVVNVDEDTREYVEGEPLRLETSGDFIYSYNSEIVFAVRPADCPVAVMSAETPKGRVNIMVHFAWRGLAVGQFDDMERALDQLEVDRSTLKIYITPGGHAENFVFQGYAPDGINNPLLNEPYLFRDLRKDNDGTYSFGVDTPHALYELFIDAGIDPKQIFLDTSDTSALDSGYSSHTRAVQMDDDNARDMLTVQFND